MKKYNLLLVAVVISCLMLLVSCSSGEETTPDIADGTYEASAISKNGDLFVEMVVEGGKITSLEVTSHSDDVDYAQKAVDELPPIIVAEQSLGVDVISGATLTSRGIIAATAQAIRDAGPNPKEYGYVPTGEVANSQQLTIIGGPEGDIVLTGDQVKAFESVSVSTVSVDASGDENPTDAVGTLLEDILNANGLSQLDYGSIILTASDGYAIEIPGEVLAIRDVIVAYQVNGEEVDLRTVVPEERAMYWVKFLDTIELMNPKQADKTTEVYIQETLIETAAIESSDYKYYEAVDQAITLDQLFEATGKQDDFVMLMGTDGWSKSEKWELAAAQYLKITGEHAPMFIGPDLPEGMRMKQNLYFKYGESCILSGEMAVLKLETEGLSLDMEQLAVLVELDTTGGIIVNYGDNQTVEIPSESLASATFVFENGEFLFSFEDISSQKVSMIMVGE